MERKFSTKEEFKEEFKRRVVEKYGRSIESAHKTEKYMVLGTMVRDYASINWKESKEEVVEKRTETDVLFLNGIFNGPFTYQQLNESWYL